MSSTSNLFSLFDDSDFDDVALEEPVSENQEKEVKQLDQQTDTTNNLSDTYSRVSVEESEKDTLIKQNSLFDDTAEKTLTTPDSLVESRNGTEAETEKNDMTDMEDIEEEEEPYNPLDHLFDMESHVIDDIEEFQSQVAETADPEESSVVAKDAPSSVEVESVEEVSLFNNTNEKPSPESAPKVEDVAAQEIPVAEQLPVVEGVAPEQTLALTQETATVVEETAPAQEPVAEKNPVVEDVATQETTPLLEAPTAQELKATEPTTAINPELPVEETVAPAPVKKRRGRKSKAQKEAEAAQKAAEEAAKEAAKAQAQVPEIPTVTEKATPALEEPSLFEDEPVEKDLPVVENTVTEEIPTAQTTPEVTEKANHVVEEPSLFDEEPVAQEKTTPTVEATSNISVEAHVEELPFEEAPVEEAPVEDVPFEEAPVEDIPAEEAPAEEAPVEAAPIEEAPVEEVPVEEAPIEDIPAEEAPVEEAPIEEAPVEEAPVEEAPIEDAFNGVEVSVPEEIPTFEEVVSVTPIETTSTLEEVEEVMAAQSTPIVEEVVSPMVEFIVSATSEVTETQAQEVPSAPAAEVDVVEQEVESMENALANAASNGSEIASSAGMEVSADSAVNADSAFSAVSDASKTSETSKAVEATDNIEIPESIEIIEHNNQNQVDVPTAVVGLLESGEWQKAQVRKLEHLETILLKSNKVKMAEEKPKTYTFEEAQTAATEYFGGDELAGRVWTSKYALKDSYGNLYERTPDDMHHRIASEIARIENNYPEPMSEQEIYGLLKEFKYVVPQGSPMTGIGNNFQVGSLSNCFVIGLDGAPDSYGGVIRIDEEQVQLMKRRGGVGHDLSHIRPKGTPVKNSALTSTGLVPFMERYSNSTREVAQDGRRGALMLTVSIKHPDAEAFIDAKLTEGKITGANVSVRIDDEFMNAAASNKPYLQRFPVESEHPAITTQEIDANALWHKITHNAWQSAEPGVLFWDTIIRESVPDCYADLGFKTISTNPCGEIPLCPYDSCRLLAINLYSYVKNPFTPEAEFDFELFRKHVGAAQRIMDDIIDLEMEQISKIIHKVEHDPEIDEVKQSEKFLWEKIRNKTLMGRRTGVGTTGEGDMLAALGLRYGTPEATEFSVSVHKALALAAYRSSVDMARTRGSFPIFDAEREKNNPYINRLKDADPELYENMLKWGRRNIACLTIAPTGTTSLMTQTTSGIEPVFMPIYKRRRKVNPNDQDVHVDYVDNDGDAFEEFVVFHPKFMEWMKVKGIEPRKNYTQEEIDNLVAMSPYAGASANEIDWMEKVRMQGAIQKWVDHSISVTINLPSDVTPELVNQLYVEAWKAGCKGCTVYRDGCRSGVLLSLQKTKKSASDQGIVPHLEHRPTELEADVVRFQNNKEKWIAFVGLIDGRPYEIFTGIADDDEGLFIPKSISKGKIIRAVNEDGTKRYDFQYVNKRGYKTTIEGLSAKFNPEYWNYAKLISGVLRMGMPIDLVVKLVSGLSLNSESINTWKMGVERALKKYITDGTKASGQCCPNCGQESLVYQEGCLICTNCGTSKCG